MANSDWAWIHEYFGAKDVGFRFPPLYNAAPSMSIPIVVSNGPERRIGTVRWGLVPEWSNTDKTSFSTFNARSETLLATPSFRNLVSRRRAVIIADGVYEWSRNKKPFRIRLKKREVFGMAGLWSKWVSPDGKREVSSTTIITCQPNFFFNRLHSRMPVILTEETLPIWLDKSITDTDTLMSVLRPYPEGEMYAYEVGALVGNVRNDGPECIEPVSSITME